MRRRQLSAHALSNYRTVYWTRNRTHNHVDRGVTPTCLNFQCCGVYEDISMFLAIGWERIIQYVVGVSSQFVSFSDVKMNVGVSIGERGR